MQQLAIAGHPLHDLHTDLRHHIALLQTAPVSTDRRMGPLIPTAKRNHSEPIEQQDNFNYFVIRLFSWLEKPDI